VASIIERIDLGCASNLMRVLISLTAALALSRHLVFTFSVDIKYFSKVRVRTANHVVLHRIR
jgi:hypothetical protein